MNKENSTMKEGERERKSVKRGVRLCLVTLTVVIVVV